jgi:hypothetical protein
MNERCALGFDADHVARALSGQLSADRRAMFEAHLEGCAGCTRTATALGRARGVWKRAIERDDAFALHAREQRLTSAEGVPRVRAGRWSVMLLGAATGALLVAGWFAIHPRAMTVATAPAPTESVAPSAIPQPPPPVPSAAPIETVVAARACRTCARGDRAKPHEVTAGAVLAREEDVDVAPGATLVLSWSLQGGLVDPMSSVDVEGPATVRATGAQGSPAILVERGVARAQTNERRELRTDLALTRGDHAAWRVDARADRTRIEGSLGEVTVEGLGAARGTILVHAGEVVDVFRDGRTVPVSRTAAKAVARASGETDLWEASEEALKRGDRAAAETSLRALIERRGPSSVHERATLRLAELELARGDRDAARARLEVSMHARERSVAAAAALLLARSQPGPRDRAEVWREYLGTSPPSPYREQASIERANALLDVGDRAGAQAIATALHAARALPDVARAGLARLDDRIGP